MMLVMLELLAVTTVVALLVGPSPLPQGQLEQPHSVGEEGITGGVTGDGTGQGPEPQGVGVGGLTGVGAGEQVSQGVQMVQGSGVTTAAGAEARSRVSWCAAHSCWPPSSSKYGGKHGRQEVQRQSNLAKAPRPRPPRRRRALTGLAADLHKCVGDGGGGRLGHGGVDLRHKVLGVRAIRGADAGVGCTGPSSGWAAQQACVGVRTIIGGTQTKCRLQGTTCGRLG